MNEQIPENGTAEDTNFTEEELDNLLQEAANIYLAASLGWTIKAGLFQGDIERYSAGDEQYDLTSLRDKVDHAMKMAEHYEKLGKVDSGGGFILKLSRPGVL